MKSLVPYSESHQRPSRSIISRGGKERCAVGKNVAFYVLLKNERVAPNLLHLSLSCYDFVCQFLVLGCPLQLNLLDCEWAININSERKLGHMESCALSTKHVGRLEGERISLKNVKWPSRPPIMLECLKLTVLGIQFSAWLLKDELSFEY